MKYKIKNRTCEHIDGVKHDGIEIEAAKWEPGLNMPHWCSYQIDPVSIPGKLMIVTPDGEAVAKVGDMIVLCNNGGLLAIDPDDFFSIYKEA